MDNLIPLTRQLVRPYLRAPSRSPKDPKMEAVSGQRCRGSFVLPIRSLGFVGFLSLTLTPVAQAGLSRNPPPATVSTVSNLFRTKPFDKPVYKLLQALRIAHGDASQWEILQAALIAFGGLHSDVREAALALARQAPSDQPEVYPIAP